MAVNAALAVLAAADHRRAMGESVGHEEARATLTATLGADGYRHLVSDTQHALRLLQRAVPAAFEEYGNDPEVVIFLGKTLLDAVDNQTTPNDALSALLLALVEPGADA